MPVASFIIHNSQFTATNANLSKCYPSFDVERKKRKEKKGKGMEGRRRIEKAKTPAVVVGGKDAELMRSRERKVVEEKDRSWVGRYTEETRSI